jgi:hypothetical protein
MIHKLGNICDVTKLKHINLSVKEALLDYTSVLTNFYGEDRDIDNDDGGYVLYAERGTTLEELETYFDYSRYLLEFAEGSDSGEVITAVYLLGNDYGVVIVIHKDDAPEEYLKEME